MHSSRMRTGSSRSLTVCRCLLPGAGVSALGGVCSRGSDLLPGGSAPLGMSAVEGCLLPGGGLLLGGGIPAFTEADPPVNRITDTSKNITLATTSLRPVTIKLA